MRQYVVGKEEVLYVYFKLERKLCLITFLSEKVYGVKRARALVHGRMVANFMKDSNAIWTVPSSVEFTEENLRHQLHISKSTADLS